MPTSTMSTAEHQAASQGHHRVGTCQTAGRPTVGTDFWSWTPPGRFDGHVRHGGRSPATLRRR